MTRKKNSLEPNYKLMLDSYIFAVQTTYRDWKTAMKQYLDASWVGMDGSMCYTSDFLELTKRADECRKKFEKALRILNEFRKQHPELKGD